MNGSTGIFFGALLLGALQGCAYDPVYAQGTLWEKTGSAFMNVMLPSNSQLENMARRRAAAPVDPFAP